MADLVPQPFDVLLRRLAHELAHGAVFDLPARSFYRAPADLDLSVVLHGERAGNGLGPAAGPHTQLAQNIVLCYLAGARVLELKTVQVNDALHIPRPCIDAQNVCFNVEWSQELALSASLAEYVKAWALVHALRHADLGLGLAGPSGDVLFDMSVGYDLAGIQSDKVRRFLGGMLNARAHLDALFDAWPKDLIAWRPDRARVSDTLSSCVTLSTFHGCPAEEIERIGEALLSDVGTHLVVKMNPTLLGYDALASLLHDQLGYTDIRLHRPAFEQDLQWDQALAITRRLASLARQRGRGFGLKFSNTLVVENHKRFFPSSEKLMYLSGQPLHVLTFELCRRFREAYGEPLDISFSAGVDARNYADCAASGFLPVTTCTDLLRPGGYARLPKYLDALATRMRERGVRTVQELVFSQSGQSASAAATASERERWQASLANHRAAAARAVADERYHAKNNRGVPRRIGTHLWLYDCIACDKCVQVCPNDANFALAVPPALRESSELPRWVVRNAAPVQEGTLRFFLTQEQQLANFADFCNECGNCDVFCPEDGGPYVLKPRFFSSRQRLEEAPPRLDGFALERVGDQATLWGRSAGRWLTLSVDLARGRARFDDGELSVEASWPAFEPGTPVARKGAPEGHVLRLDFARGMAALLSALLVPSASTPVNAPYLPATPPPAC